MPLEAGDITMLAEAIRNNQHGFNIKNVSGKDIKRRYVASDPHFEIEHLYCIKNFRFLDFLPQTHSIFNFHYKNVAVTQ